MKIAVSGDIGSFSAMAANLYITKNPNKKYELEYLIDMDGALSSVANGVCELAIFPFINYNSGVVMPAFIAMGKYNFVPIPIFVNFL